MIPPPLGGPPSISFKKEIGWWISFRFLFGRHLTARLFPSLYHSPCVGVLDQALGSGKEIGEGGGRGIQLAARLLENFCRVPFG